MSALDWDSSVDTKVPLPRSFDGEEVEVQRDDGGKQQEGDGHRDDKQGSWVKIAFGEPDFWDDNAYGGGGQDLWGDARPLCYEDNVRMLGTPEYNYFHNEDAPSSQQGQQHYEIYDDPLVNDWQGLPLSHHLPARRVVADHFDQQAGFPMSSTRQNANALIGVESQAGDNSGGVLTFFGPESPTLVPRALPGTEIRIPRREASPFRMRRVYRTATLSSSSKWDVPLQTASKAREVRFEDSATQKGSSRVDGTTDPNLPHHRLSVLQSKEERAEAGGGSRRFDTTSMIPEVDIWPLYLEHALVEDKEMVHAWNSDLDSILIFAALFSAVLTTLVIESYKNLQPDPQVEMLRAVLLQLQLTSGDATVKVTAPIPPYRLTRSAVRVNIYWFSSLIISLSTALLAILAKQWVNYLLAGLSPVPSTRGRHRQYRMDGLHKWSLPAVLSFLPLLLHIALLLFFAGLVDFVWELDGGIGAVAASLVIATFLAYIATNVLSYIYPECPFKTSVTVFISVGHDLLSVLYDTSRAKGQALWMVLRAHLRQVPISFRRRRVSGRGAVSLEIPDLGVVKKTVLSERPKYNTLRISSLRYQDEQFISQNASLMDTRVLIWLMHNVGRLAIPEELGHALIRFPHLVRHRELLIQEGAATFLERLFKSWFDKPYDELSNRNRRDVAAVVRTIGTLLSEAEVNDPMYAEMAVHTNTVSDGIPSLIIQRHTQSSQVLLSRESLQLLGHLLVNIRDLPLPLAAFVLRLSVQMTKGDAVAQWETLWETLGGNQIIETFIDRVLKFSDVPQPEFLPAVNTVVYLALCDTVRPHSGASPFSSSDDGVRYWLNTLLNVINHVPMDDPVLRQMCWGICALSWLSSSLCVSDLDATRPLIPRLRDMHDLSHAVVDLLSCNQDLDILSTVIMALERILWTFGSQASDGHGDLCHALQGRYGHFLADLYKRLSSDMFPVARVSQFLQSLIRITAYLSFFDKNGHASAKVPLTATLFSILNHLISVRYPRPFSASGPSSVEPDGGILGDITRPWLYRVACRFVILYTNDLQRELVHQEPSPNELIFKGDSMESIITIGTDIASALASVASSSVVDNEERPVRSSSLQPFTLELFCNIIKDVFVRGLRDSEDVRDIGGWDRRIVLMVSEAVRSHNLLDILCSSPHPCVRVNLLLPVVHYIYTALFSGDRPNQTEFIPLPRQRATEQNGRYHHRHPAQRLALALRNSFLPFLRKFTEAIAKGSHLYPEMQKILVELTGITGFLAFFAQPAAAPRPRLVDGMINYLRTLRALPSGVTYDLHMPLRRHAWQVLGNMGDLCLREAGALALDYNPARHFRFDKASPDEVASGLIRILAMRMVQLMREEYKPHCPDCGLLEHMTAEEKWKKKHVPLTLVEEALYVMVGIWDDTDEESKAIRTRLLHHDIGREVQSLSLISTGNVGVVATKLFARIEMTSANGHTPQRRLTV